MTKDNYFVSTSSAHTQSGPLEHQIAMKIITPRVLRAGSFAVIGTLWTAAAFAQTPTPPNPFTDISITDQYANEVDYLYQQGITAGCNLSPLQFCPSLATQRQQMAVYIVTSLRLAQGLPTTGFNYSPTPYFNDVPTNNPYFPFVQSLKELGITAGCSVSPPLFCPADNVTNGQMAVFTIAAWEQIPGNSLVSWTTTPYYVDVPSTHIFFKFIQKATDLNVFKPVNLCGTNMFCPESAITRGQTAIDIVRGIIGILNWSTGSSGPPIVTLTDLTQGSPYYFVGDSFTLTVTGAAREPVSVIQNGAASGVVGYTNASGAYSVSGTWGASYAGAYAQVWSVGGAPAAPLVFEIIESSGSTDGPASIPGSFTGGVPPLACANITGNWIATPSAGPTSEWDLTQSGNQITGTSYESYGPSCGVISYTVSGNYSPGNGIPTFTLNATNPNPPTDGCGNVPLTPDTHTVRIFGNSCSTGTGTWYSGTGSGPLQQQSKTTPNVVTANKTTAHYSVFYANYIPVDQVNGGACFYYIGGNIFATSKIYIGDANRGNPSLLGSGYRAFQSTVVIPGSAYVYNPYLNTGATRNYGYGSPANGTTLDSTPLTSDIYNGPYSGMDEDGIPNDCRLWNASGHADTKDMATPSVIFPYPTQAQVLFAGSASDPLEPPVAAESWT